MLWNRFHALQCERGQTIKTRIFRWIIRLRAADNLDEKMKYMKSLLLRTAWRRWMNHTVENRIISKWGKNTKIQEGLRCSRIQVFQIWCMSCVTTKAFHHSVLHFADSSLRRFTSDLTPFHLILKLHLKICCRNFFLKQFSYISLSFFFLFHPMYSINTFYRNGHQENMVA